MLSKISSKREYVTPFSIERTSQNVINVEKHGLWSPLEQIAIKVGRDKWEGERGD